MNNERLQKLAGILTEAKTLSGHLGTLTNTIDLGDIPADYAYSLEKILRRPDIGWHTKLKHNSGEWELTLTINVDRDKLE